MKSGCNRGWSSDSKRRIPGSSCPCRGQGPPSSVATEADMPCDSRAPAPPPRQSWCLGMCQFNWLSPPQDPSCNYMILLCGLKQTLQGRRVAMSYRDGNLIRTGINYIKAIQARSLTLIFWIWYKSLFKLKLLEPQRWKAALHLLKKWIYVLLSTWNIFRALLYLSVYVWRWYVYVCDVGRGS